VHQGIRARDQLHRHLEEAISEKLREDQAAEPGDALNLISHSARELGHELSVQELKVGGGHCFSPLFFPSRSGHILYIPGHMIFGTILRLRHTDQGKRKRRPRF
jgi:hypothetical protein